MKIVFITTTLSTGGAEMMLLKLLQHLDRGRFEPSVISLRTAGEIGPRIAALGIPVLALDMAPGLPNPLKFFALVRHLRKMQPDLVQTWMYHADFLGGIAARLAGCRKIVWALRNSNLDPKLTKRSTLGVVKACAVLSSALPSCILSCSARARTIHEEIGYPADRMRVIPNGFDLAEFHPDSDARQSVRAELGLPADALLAGLMARHDPQKNHAGFIEAAARVHAEMPTAHFMLAGTGVDEGNAVLRAAIAAQGLGTCTHLLGRRDDMPRLMAALDVLVSSSFGEAFPNVLGEAMACGVPCVVTDAGDSAEIVGETGRVAAVGDMPGLAQNMLAILRLPSAEKSRVGQAARERIAAHFEIGHVTRLYETVYAQVAGDRMTGRE